MRVPGAAIAFVVLVGAGLPSLARAADADPDTEVARRHFDAGSKRYEVQDYAGALKEFRAASLVKPVAAFDFNIARCLDRMERYPEALEAYRRFVDKTPDPADSREARERVRILTDRLAAIAAQQGKPVEKRPAVDEKSPAVDGAEPRRGSIVAPLLVGAAAIVLVAIGGGLYGAAHAQFNDLASSCAPGCAPSQWSGLDLQEQVGVALMVTAGVVAVVDAALWALASRRRGDHALWVAPSGNGLAFGGGF